MFKTKKEKQDKDIMKENLDELEELTEKKDEQLLGEKSDVETEKSDVETKDSDLSNQVKLLRDQLMRKAAEFENYKKRTENELSSFFKYANESLISALLPVLDDFDRVFKSDTVKHDIETYKKGIELTYEKIMGILKKQGLKEMKTTGNKFDFNLHDALLQILDEKHEPNTILETVEKGYYLKDKVLRHAKVVVSSKPENNAVHNKENNEDSTK